MHAARTLKTFAEMGHQVLMFTCHEHISKIFQEIDVQVRLLPPQGTPGRATILEPIEEAYLPTIERYEEAPAIEVITHDEPIVAEMQIEEPITEVVVARTLPIVEAPAVVIDEPIIRRPKERPQPPRVREPEVEEPAIDWNWYEEWGEPIEEVPTQQVEGIWERSVAWSEPKPTISR